MKAVAKYFPWLALTAILGALACVVLWTKQPPEPVYQGKRLSEWLAGYDEPSPETEEVLRRAGTNAIPTLLRMLRAKDSKVRTRLMVWVRKHHLVKFEYTYAYQKNAWAAAAFDSLGTQAHEAVPELIEIFEQNISPYSQTYTISALGGTRSVRAIPTLLRATTNMNTSTRCNAICALGKIRAEPERVVPVLTRFLKDPNRSVRAMTISSLVLFGSDAKPAVPDLIQSLNDPTMRTLAKYAIPKIDPEAAVKLGLTNTLEQVDGGWRLVK